MHRHSHTQMHRKYRHYTSTHTHTHTYAKERVLLSASTLTVPASAESTVLSTLPMGTALHLPLSHWHNKRVAVRNVKPETSREKGRSTETEREIKRDRGTEREAKRTVAVAEAIKCRAVYTWLPSLSTISFYSFFSLSLLFSCLKVKFSQAETCHISAPLMCTTGR